MKKNTSNKGKIIFFLVIVIFSTCLLYLSLELNQTHNNVNENINIPLHRPPLRNRQKQFALLRPNGISPIVWKVLNPNGLQVRNSIDLNATITAVLPAGLKIIGKKIGIVTNPRHNYELVYCLYITFPLFGWISIESYTQTAYYNVKLLKYQTSNTSVSREANQSYSLNHQSSGVDPLCLPKFHHPMSDYAGGDLSSNSVKANDATSCCMQCVEQSECFRWTFTPDGDCWLKNELSILQSSGIVNLISGDIVNKSPQSSIYRQGERLHDTTSSCCTYERYERYQKRPKACLFRNSSYIYNQIKTFSTYDLINIDEVCYEMIIDIIDGIDETAKQKPVESTSSYILYSKRIQKMTTWNQQWPIGNGVFGGLVGGSIKYELIPLSISGFFSHHHRQTMEQPNEKKQRYKIFQAARKAFTTGSIDEAESLMNSLKEDANTLGMFEYVGDLNLLFSPFPFGNQFTPPPNNNLPKGNNPPFISQIVPGGRYGSLKALERKVNSVQHPPSHGKLHPVEEGSKDAIIIVSDSFLDLKHGISHDVFIESLTDEHPLSTDILFNSSTNSSQIALNTVLAHYRTWFTSAVDHVMMGMFSCRSYSIKKHNRNCLNVALELSRQHYDNENFPDWIVDVFPEDLFSSSSNFKINLNPSSRHLWLNEEEEMTPDGRMEIGKLANQLDLFAIDVALLSNEKIRIPDTQISALIICTGYNEESNPADNFNSKIIKDDKISGMTPPDQKKSTGVIACNNARTMHIILTIDTVELYQGSEEYRQNIKKDENVFEKLRARNEKRLLEAWNQGPNELRLRHIENFKEKMNRVDLHLESSNTTRTCSDIDTSDLTDRMKSFSKGCLIDSMITDSDNFKSGGSETLNSKGTDLHLLNSYFNVGRYLLSSSSTSSRHSKSTMSNLQGIWADGPTSAWNGDYHLNINTQEIYWASDAIGLKESTDALVDFILNLNQKGTITAQELYGCNDIRSWVAHGFTDNDLNTGLLGDSQWSLCVTCGAWLALHMWEKLLYKRIDFFPVKEDRTPNDNFEKSNDIKELLSYLVKLLTVLRGITTFFTEYLTTLECGSSSDAPCSSTTGFVYTGPTTSPENSYQLYFKIPKQINNSNQISHQEVKTVTHLAMSPAFDVSILRQVSSAYSLSVAWLARFIDSKDLEKNEEINITDTSMKEDIERGMWYQPYIKYHIFECFSIGCETAEKFRELISRMLENALPKIQKKFNKSQIQEYSDLWTNSETFKEQTVIQSTVENIDLGHRHFSFMHWLYPNTFLPISKRYDATNLDLYEAAVNSLMIKKANHGGHTSWSAAWEACLWARLLRGDDAMDSINRIIQRYSASNLLSLHPPLSPNGPPGCQTCFSERIIFSGSPTRRSFDPSPRSQPYPRSWWRDPSEDTIPGLDQALFTRGMITPDESKFQLDGNLGLVAALIEMIVQSHNPGLIHLLPALPSALSERGKIYNIKLRGDVELSMTWTRGDGPYVRVQAGFVQFNSFHPWLFDIEEVSSYPGFYHSKSSPSNRASGEYPLVGIVSPNPIKFFVSSDFSYQQSSNDTSDVPLKRPHLIPLKLSKVTESSPIQIIDGCFRTERHIQNNVRLPRHPFLIDRTSGLFHSPNPDDKLEYTIEYIRLLSTPCRVYICDHMVNDCFHALEELNVLNTDKENEMDNDL